MSTQRSVFPRARAWQPWLLAAGLLCLVVLGSLALPRWLTPPERSSPTQSGSGEVSTTDIAGDTGTDEEPRQSRLYSSLGFHSSSPRPTSRPSSAHLPPTNRQAGLAPECYLGVVVPSDASEIVAEVEGRILDVRVRPGDRVEAGDVLVVLDNEALGHQLTIEEGNMALIDAEVSSFTAQLEQTRRMHERRMALDGLISRQDAETSQTALDLAVYRVDVAHAEHRQQVARMAQLRADMERLEIRAPFAGTVGMRYLDRGSVVQAGTPILRLLGQDVARVRFAVPPALSDSLALGTPLRVELPSLGLTTMAEVEQRAPQIDSASGLVFFETRLVSELLRTIPPGAVARVSRAASSESPESPESSDDLAPSCRRQRTSASTEIAGLY